MAIYVKDKKAVVYKGDYEPVNIYDKDKKVAGWKNETQTGDNLTFVDTYNDKVISAEVKGNTVQQSEWVQAEGQSSQDGIPAPDNPIPITSNLPAGTYKVADYKGDWYEFTLTEELRGIGSVLDSVEFDRISHVGFLRRKCSLRTFDGTETWSAYATGTNNGYLAFLSGFIYLSGGASNGLMVSTHFKPYASGNILYNLAGEGQCTTTSPAGGTVIKIHPDRLSSADASGLKAWLLGLYNDGNPNKVIYQLNTPTRVPLTFTRNDNSTAPECPMEFLTDTPSPEYPAEIYDAQGEIEVRGKNLLDLSILETPRTHNGVTIQYLSNEDCLLINGVASANSSVPSPRVYSNIPIVNGSRFTISTKYISGAVTRPSGSEYAVAYFGANNNINASTDWRGCDLLNTNSLRENTVCNYNYITAFWIYSTTGVIYDNYKVKIQLEQNTVATPYEPYREPQTVTTPTLRSLPDGTKDEWNVLTGEITRRVGFKVLDGTENINFLDSKDNTVRMAYTATDAENNYPVISLMCSHFPVTLYPVSESSDTEMVSLVSTSRFAFRINKNRLTGWQDSWTNTEKVSAFKSFLATQDAAGTPVTVQYKLAEPIIENVTVQPLRTYPKTTVIQTANDTIAELETTATVRIFDKNI